jgi:excinuclease ABC subunit C
MTSQQLAEFNLPDVPGVYFFKQGETILYIGKATSLRDRTRSYFADDLIETRGASIVDMVFKAETMDWRETETVIEALILEAKLIKEYLPYYNVKEKDDKSWNYVTITKELLPKVMIVRGKEIDFDKKEANGWKLKSIYGPFTSGGSLKEALKIIRRIFPFIDSSSAKKDNYHFYRQLGLTPTVNPDDPIEKIEQDENCKAYFRNIKNIQLFFEGKKKTILKELAVEMYAYAKKEEFERAGEVRRQIFALEHINDVALIRNEKDRTGIKAGFRIEAYDIAHMSGKNMVGVMTVVTNGEKDSNEYRKFIIRSQSNANDIGALEEVLSRRFRHTEWGMPDLIVMDGGEAQLRIGNQVINRYQLGIPVVSVVKDDSHKARAILGDETLIKPHQKDILFANVEAHRYGITFHKKKRAKSFLNIGKPKAKKYTK